MPENIPTDSLVQDSQQVLLFPDTFMTDTPQAVVIPSFCDSVIKPQSLYHQLHAYGDSLPYSPANDLWFTGILLGTFLLILMTVGHQHKYIGKQARKFFMPTNNKEEKAHQKTTSEHYMPHVLASTLVLSNGLLLYLYADYTYDLRLGVYSPWQVMGVCIGLLAAYHLLRRTLYSFTNWVFFERTERHRWNATYHFLILVDSLLAYPLLFCGMFLRQDIEFVAWEILICYGLTRIMLLICTKRFFFFNFYGILHLFVYLCTLEIAPLLFLWKFMVVLSSNLVLK